DAVPFRATHGDPADPEALHGTVLGEPAVTYRRFLVRPYCLPVYPLSLLAHRPSLQGHLVDPLSRPLRVSRNLKKSLEYSTIKGDPHPCPGLFLLALDALTRKFSPLPAVVSQVTREFVSVDIYGVRLAVYPEQCHWEKEAPISTLFRLGQSV